MFADVYSIIIAVWRILQGTLDYSRECARENWKISGARACVHIVCVSVCGWHGCGDAAVISVASFLSAV